MTSDFQVHAERRAVRPDDVLFRELDGEAVILNLDNEQYYGLDEVGTRMYLLLTGGDTVKAAYDTMLAEFEVDEATLQADFVRMIDELTGQGLLAWEDA